MSCLALTLKNTPCKSRCINHTNWCATHTKTSSTFSHYLEAMGFSVIQQRADGNCLFRSISTAMFGVPNMHDQLRLAAVNTLRANSNWANYIDSDIEEYCSAMICDGEWGSDLEISVIAELYGASFVVITMNGKYRLGLSDNEYYLAFDENHYSACFKN